MFLEVTIKVCLLPEATLAECTLEGTLLVVNVPHMTLEIAGYAEGTFAVLALVRLLAGVRPKMAGKVCGSREHFATELARVSVLVLGARRKVVVDAVRVVVVIVVRNPVAVGALT